MLGMILRILNSLAQALAVLGCIAVVVIALADVGLRFFLNRPILGANEMTEALLAVIVAVGFILCGQARDQIRVTLFEGQILRIIPAKAYAIWVYLWELVFTAIIALFMWEHAKRLFANYEYATVLDYPLGRLFVCVSLLFALAVIGLLIGRNPLYPTQKDAK